MRLVILATLAMVAVPAAAEQWEWREAREVPWANHSDWRISAYSREGDSRYDLWWQRAQLVCTQGAYDFVLRSIRTSSSVGRRTGVAAWLLGETYEIPHPTVVEARYRIDGDEWRTLQHARYYSTAGSQDHDVAFPFGVDAVARFKASGSVEFVVKLSDNETKRSTISLIGFTKAFNTLPPLEKCR